jgi:secondary thiamine-phosphate synthase enzyme
MDWKSSELRVRTPGRGLHDITPRILAEVEKFGVREGMLFLYLQHTSASLCISENWDPTARRDLESFLERLAPDGAAWHAHTIEGDDDSSSHMKSIVTGVDLSIPIGNGKPLLGTWQGIYLCEHRTMPHERTVLIRILKAA